MNHRSHKSRRDRDRYRDEREYEEPMDWREERDEALARNGFALSEADANQAVAEIATREMQEAALKAARERAQTAELALANRVHVWTFRLWVAGAMLLGALGGYIARVLTA